MLRLPVDKTKVMNVINKVFVPSKPVQITLYPTIMIENPKCGCGNEAKYMLEDMSLTCNECLNKMMIHTSILQEKEDTAIPLNEGTIKRLRFEWSPDGERWYSVQGRNLIIGNVNSFIADLRKGIIADVPMETEAEYVKETKKMTILN